MRLGIGARLLLAHLVLSCIVIGAVQGVLRPALRGSLEAQLAERLQSAAAVLAADIGEGQDPVGATARIGRATGLRMSVIAPDGRLVADSAVEREQVAHAESHAARPEVVDARAGHPEVHARRSTTTGRSWWYLAVALPDATVARAAASEESVEASLGAVSRALLLAAGLGLLLAAVLGFAASRVADRAVASFTTTARRMAAGDLSVPASTGGPAEFQAIGTALQRLAAELAAQLGRLTAERDLLEAVLASMEEAVLVLRPDGGILHANGTARHLLAIPPAAQGPLIESLRLPPLLDAVRHAAAGTPAGLELLLASPRRELVGRAAPLPRGGEAAVVVVLREVTELRRLEAIRREFVANASHELRTPVATIRGYAETLQGGAMQDPETAVKFLTGLTRQAERLSTLIDDLLDLGRIESGGLRLQPETVSVPDALRRLADGARDRAERKGLALVVAPGDEALRVRVDPRALDMALGNLLDNAVKYTPAGGSVKLAASAVEGGVRLEVTDTGPGIEPQHLPRIFERFYRVDPGRSRELGGTGLGLSIAKHVVQQSGGEIGVESTPGEGSRFWIRLPAAPADAPARNAGPAPTP